MNEDALKADLLHEAGVLSSLIKTANFPIKRFRPIRPQLSSHAGVFSMLATLEDGGVIGIWLDRSSGHDRPLYWCGLYYSEESLFEKALTKISPKAKPGLRLRMDDMVERQDVGLVPAAPLSYIQMLSTVEERLGSDKVDECYVGRYFQEYDAQDAITYLRAILGDDHLPSVFWEGRPTQRMVDIYERDARARDACISQKGCRCAVCDFDFGEMYGDIGEGYIHVHHLNPIAERGKSTKTLVRDLVPVCPNCHAMLHSQGLKTPEELQKIVQHQRRK